jgi:hypothetical protein
MVPATPHRDLPVGAGVVSIDADMSRPPLATLSLAVLLTASSLLACGSSSSSSSPDSAAVVDAIWPWANADGGPADGPTTTPERDTAAPSPDGPAVTADGPAVTADGPAASADGPAAACASRTGGALVTLSICQGEKVTLWITDPAFITEAVAKKGMPKGRIPAFDLVDGRDCDAAWSWHVKPGTAAWADLSTEVCDGCPHLVEQDKASWLKLGRYCPWSAAVADVVDRR